MKNNKIDEESMKNECAMNNVENATNDECINITLEELEQDGLVPPSDFNSETEPTTMLDAIDFVNSTLQRYMNVSEEFDFADCHGNVLDYLARRLQVAPLEAFLFCICVEVGPDRITFNDFSRLLELSKARTLSLTSHFNSLVRKRLLTFARNSWGEQNYNIPFRVIKTLTDNVDYEPPQRKFNDDEGVLDCFGECLDEMDNGNIGQSMLIDEVEILLAENKKVHLCSEINKLGLDKQSQLLLMFFCDMLVNENNSELTIFDLDNLFPNKREFSLVKNSLRTGRHELIKRGIIEYCCSNGTADTGMFTLTEKARKKLLAKFNLNKDDEKVSGLTLANSIKPKGLFYSATVGKQVDDLARFLEDKKYKEIVQRMKKRYNRAGLTCLLYGGPGTGKTETVYQLARRTGRDILAVDVSQLRSKWVGESEKNVKALFDFYRRLVKKSAVTPILLFNEADALFGVRMVGAERSVDKMNNTMQNIILQEMETLDGILIATTNLTENLDGAFDRRFLYKVKFDRPDDSVRSRIWQQMLPELTTEECDTLGRVYDLSGGQIENVARKFSVNSILNGEETTDRMNLLHELCSNECINDNNANARRVGFVA